MDYLTKIIDKFESIKKKVLTSKTKEGFENDGEVLFDNNGYSTKRLKNAANNNDRTRATGLSITQIEDLLSNLDEQDGKKWKKERSDIKKRKSDENLSQEEYIKLITPVIEKYFNTLAKTSRESLSFAFLKKKGSAAYLNA